jgi:hypothetical protein
VWQPRVRNLAFRWPWEARYPGRYSDPGTACASGTR